MKENKITYSYDVVLSSASERAQCLEINIGRGMDLKSHSLGITLGQLLVAQLHF